MAEHTPGPWYATGSDPDFGLSVRRESDHEVITKIETAYSGSAANARLIAAAPELLAALEAFVATYENIGHGCWPVDKNNPYNILDRARAAIRKATGK